MFGSFLAGPPREADKGGKRGMEGDFLRSIRAVSQEPFDRLRARQSHGDGEIATLRSGLRLIAMTWFIATAPSASARAK